jgi:hypothetical protein
VTQFEKPKPKIEYDEEYRKFKLAKGARWDSGLLPVIQNLAACGCTESDIGVILGADKDRALTLVANLKAKHPDIKKAWQAGIQMAHSILVAQMLRSAIGYDYEDVDLEYKYVQNPKNPEELKEVLVGKKVRKRHQAANAPLAMFMASNRMPDQFVDRKVLERRSIEVKLDKVPTEHQINDLAGKLRRIQEDRKVVEAELVE